MHARSEAIQQTIQNFQSGCAEWEGEVLELFDDVARFLAVEGSAGAGQVSASVAQDVAGLKGLVEQQTEVLAALVNALTGPSTVDEQDCEAEQSAAAEAAAYDPFERLQQAVAAACESS